MTLTYSRVHVMLYLSVFNITLSLGGSTAPSARTMVQSSTLMKTLLLKGATAAVQVCYFLSLSVDILKRRAILSLQCEYKNNVNPSHYTCGIKIKRLNEVVTNITTTNPWYATVPFAFFLPQNIRLC